MMLIIDGVALIFLIAWSIRNLRAGKLKDPPKSPEDHAWRDCMKAISLSQDERVGGEGTWQKKN